MQLQWEVVRVVQGGCGVGAEWGVGWVWGAEQCGVWGVRGVQSSVGCEVGVVGAEWCRV